MCGICGFFSNITSIDKKFFDSLVDSLSHRGPDDRGVFIHKNNALGMRRLSIIDLEYGKQPMSNEDETVWVVYNGEIYNHKELRDDLASHNHIFKTHHSDTEVLLHGYEQWGIDGLLEKLNGIYAFAIYDIPNNALFLARDKLGVKPLYYTQNHNAFTFASEVKTLILSGEAGTEINKEALMLYLKYQFVPGEQTILEDVKKLPPSHVLKYKDGQVKVWKYWDFCEPEKSPPPPFSKAAEELKDLLLDTIERQMMSDVPIAVFLSGGLDSSIIAYLMAQKRSAPIKSYAIVFPGDKLHDESGFSQKVARDIHSDHTEIVFDESSLLDVIDKVIKSMDEPIADPAIIPTYYLSKEAGRKVKVILTGEGADEVFGGYPYYQQFVDKWGYFASKKLSLVRTQMKMLKSLIKCGCPAGDATRLSSSKLSGFPYSLPQSYLLSLVKESALRPELAKVITNYEIHASSHLKNVTRLQKALYLDTKLWLAEDLMMKLDKMTMAHSLEGRVPFLDHRLVKFAFNLPDTYKVGRACGKAILREAVKTFLPQEICDRKKHGFNVPLYLWFRGKLKTFVSDSLGAQAIRTSGFLEQKSIDKLIDDHMNRNINAARALWILIVLCRWLEHVKSIKPIRSDNK